VAGGVVLLSPLRFLLERIGVPQAAPALFSVVPAWRSSWHCVYMCVLHSLAGGVARRLAVRRALSSFL
jgi:hypothetical protein